MSQVSSRAAAAVAQAKAAGAERYAPYAYTTAELYLEKAREEGGQAQYQVAIEYGRRAEEMATRARLLSEQKEPEVEYPDGVVGGEPPAMSGDAP